ncbi:MAG: TIGR04283 family arsenosugar biosynthesis glycosyltransferase, partial [Acidobacteriota bacterium]
MHAPSRDISVVIPALNEANPIASALNSIQISDGIECIVVDGGSRDKTPEVAQSSGARILHSPPGRARQMNAGAKAARGEFLVFLHADTRLPARFADHVRRILGTTGVAAGAFQLKIDHPAPGLRIVERGANWRSKYLKSPYGDQAIFLRRQLFNKVGGFPELPIMEDFQLIRRVRRQGRIVIAPAAVLTSPRRWQRMGSWRVTLINQVVIMGFLLGVDPGRLARWYGRGSA